MINCRAQVMGGDVVRRDQPRSPGSDGASPYPELPLHRNRAHLTITLFAGLNKSSRAFRSAFSDQIFP
jgi:hypothetical protein